MGKEEKPNPPLEKDTGSASSGADLSKSTIMSKDDNASFRDLRSKQIDEEKTEATFGRPEIDFDDTVLGAPPQDAPREQATPSESTPAAVKDEKLESEIAAFEQSLGSVEGMNPERAHTIGQHMRTAFNRLDGIKPEQFGKADAANQVRSMIADMNRVIEHDGFVGGEKIYSQEDQNKIVEDMARSAADPEKYINQGQHFTCVAQSNRLAHMTTDPADAVRIGADLATTHATVFKGKEGDAPREVLIGYDSMPFDSESRDSDDATVAQQGRQGPFGQLYALAAVQGALQMRAERESPPGDIVYDYQQLRDVSKTDSGERIWRYARNPKDGGIERKELGRSPMMQAHDAANMARLTMGETDGLLIHADTMDYLKIAKHDGISTFKDDAGLEKLAKEYQERTGRPPRFVVNAKRLPDVPPQGLGHSLHQMTLAYQEATRTFDDDGQTWGELGDRPDRDMTIEQVMEATHIIGSPKPEAPKALPKSINAAINAWQEMQSQLNQAISQERMSELYQERIGL